MPITTEVRDRIGELVIDHPPVNALDSRSWNELAEAVATIGRDPQVRVVLIRAEGKGFCGGVDIKEMQSHPERIVELNRGNYLTFRAVRSCEVPVVAAVHGFVIGGGIGICGASDVIIAADDAYFSLPEIDRGAMGGASHLSRMLPLHKVRAAFFTGGKIPAMEAYRLGALEKVVPRHQLLAKESLNGLEPRDVDHGYRFEQGFTLEMYLHPDSQKARDAFVENKGPAKL
jgi:enoyl-CoA hydratase